MDSKQTLALVVLTTAVLGRAEKAQQILRALSADDPTGTYVVEPDNPDKPIPDIGEDWRFRILEVQRFGDTLEVSATREAKLGPKPQETTDES